MSNTPELGRCLVPGFVPSKKDGEIRLPICVHCHVANSTPDVAIDVLSRTQQALLEAGLLTYRTPFGWFNTLHIDAKGHPISRVARLVSADA